MQRFVAVELAVSEIEREQPNRQTNRLDDYRNPLLRMRVRVNYVCDCVRLCLLKSYDIAPCRVNSP